MSIDNFKDCVAMFLCPVFAPAGLPYNVIDPCQLKSVSADNKSLDNLIGDENLGSVGSDYSWAKVLECRFTSPLNKSGLQVAVGL